jgi:hypothetical protein
MPKNEKPLIFSFPLIKSKKFLTSIFCILIVIFVIMPLLLTQISSFFYFDSSSAFIGDTFGGITSPLIGFIAAVFTFFAFYIQYEANLLHAKNFKNQQIENIFFHMLQTLRSIKNELMLTEQNKTIQGKMCLGYALIKLGEHDKKVNFSAKETLSTDKETFIANSSHRIEQITKAWNEFHKKNGDFLNEYYIYIYNIFDFILNHSKIDSETQALYIKQFKAQLSNDEIALLFYYPFSFDSAKVAPESSLKRWLDEFGVLENLTDRGLLFKYDYLLYEKTNFKFLTNGGNHAK